MHQTQPETVPTSLMSLLTEFSDLFDTSTLSLIKGFKAHPHQAELQLQAVHNSTCVICFPTQGRGWAWSVGVSGHHKQGENSRVQHDSDRTCAETKRPNLNLRRLQSISKSVPWPYSVYSTSHRRSIRPAITWSSRLQARSTWCVPSGRALRWIKAWHSHQNSPRFIPIQSFLFRIIICPSDFSRHHWTYSASSQRSLTLPGQYCTQRLQPWLSSTGTQTCFPSLTSSGCKAQTREMCLRSTFYQVPRTHPQRRWSSTRPQ